MRRFGDRGKQALQVVGRAVQIGLEHGPDGVVTGVAESLVDAQRHLDVVRLLHVDADERLELFRPACQALDVLVRELLVEGEAEVRELECDVRLQLLGDEALDDRLVLGSDGGGALGVRDRLAEQCRVRVQAVVVEPPEHRDARVERLACDEASRADPLAVALHEALHARALGRMEDRGSRQRRDGCAKVGHAVPSLPRGRVSSGSGRAASPRATRTGRPSSGARRSRARPGRR